VEEGAEKFVKYLGIFVYRFLTEQYHLSWWQAVLVILLILCGLFLVACICLVAWVKAREFFSRLEPESVGRHKRLWVLIGVAGWVTIACFIAQSATRNLFYFLELAITYSVPALLFGGVILWWLRDSKGH
jgi:hypothetical protein